MANAPLQQFIKKESPWRFLKLALKLRAPEPAFRHVLVTLADHANGDGVCYPSYDLLLAETAYTSKQTITGALKHWRAAGVLTWKKGWGNSHKRRSNEYQFNEAAMKALVTQQKAERGNLSEESDEISVGPDEISVRPDESSVGGGMKAHPLVAKVSVLEGPKNKTSQLPKEGGALLSDGGTGTGSSTAKQAQVKESPPREISSQSSPNEISSPSCVVTTIPAYLEFAEYEHSDPPAKRWGFKRNGGSATAAQVAEIQRLNRERVQPTSTHNS